LQFLFLSHKFMDSADVRTNNRGVRLNMMDAESGSSEHSQPDIGGKEPNLLGLLFRIVLFIVFMATGLSKLLAGSGIRVIEFSSFGWPSWSLYVVGAFEILGSFLILLPKTTAIASSIFCLVLLGATGTHLFMGEFLRAFFTGTLFTITAWLTLNDPSSVSIELELDKDFDSEHFKDVEDTTQSHDKSA
jgi:uncharacterized membrane protein YphA (DoxX/SURF4 family)